MRSECYFCHTRTIERLIEKFKPSDDIAENFVGDICNILYENGDMNNPNLAAMVHRKASVAFNNANLYAEEKQHANQLLMERYAALKKFILQSTNPFHTAAKLAVAGNIIDYGAHTASNDVEGLVMRHVQLPLKIDKSNELKIAAAKAKKILYLGDNAGEIVCDKLFIELLNHKDLTFAYRGFPVINDITIEDVEAVQMNKVCKTVSNGYDAPSTILEHCSDEFLEVYSQADLIISKGQGNFEGLMDNKDKAIFFMLMAKCDPIAELLNVEKGDLVITKNTF